jgi:hypothetical protein
MALTNETDEQIEARINERFDILELLSAGATDGNIRSLIASGPPGLGKSYTVETTLRNWDAEEDNHTIIKGYVRATGLVKLLYDYSDAGKVLVFDDSDNIFYDELSLNLIKTVCDTTATRRVAWLSEGELISDLTGESIPRYFDFNGSIIFITNLDFDDLINRGHKLAPHLSALMSRSHYIDLTLKTRRDYLVRIRQVIFEGLLGYLNFHEQAQVLEFIEDNCDNLRELSLRMAIKIGNLRKANKDNWEKLARITCCK